MINDIIHNWTKIIGKNKEYWINYGLISIIGILRAIDVYLTYKGMSIDPEGFIELNPLYEKLIYNKSLIIGINIGYVGFLAFLNYLFKKLAYYLDFLSLIKLGSISLGFNIGINLLVIFSNLEALMEISRGV